MINRNQFFKQPSFIPIFQDYNVFSGKKIGMTGGSGILGSLLSDRLEEHNIDVIKYSGNILDNSSLREWFKSYEFDYFFHFAAVVPVKIVETNPLSSYEVNVIGCYNICKNISIFQKKTWLFMASSSHVYKPNNVINNKQPSPNSIVGPTSFYGLSKLAGEQVSIPIIDRYQLNACIGRIFSFTDKKQKPPFLVPSIIDKISKLPDNGEIIIKNANSIRDIIDAQTVIDSIFYLAKNSYNGIINIGSGKGLKISDIAKYIVKSLDRKIIILSDSFKNENSLIADIRIINKIINDGITK